MDTKVDITGLDKAEVLATLYNHSHVQGMGRLHARGSLTVEEVRKEIERGDDHARMFGTHVHSNPLYFDYFFGRPLKVNLGGDSFDPWGYDRDNGGDGTAEKLIQELREAKKLIQELQKAKNTRK